MAKTSESQLKAIKKYNEKSKYIQLKFTENQLEEYDKIVKHCQENGLSYQGYIKGLIQKDLEEKEGTIKESESEPKPAQKDVYTSSIRKEAENTLVEPFKPLKNPIYNLDEKNTEK